MTPTLAALYAHEFFAALVYTGLACLIAVIIPVQIVAKYRRHRLKRHRIICRICGHRFLRKDPAATCPHCESKNR